jgi:hypothetical protein
MSPDTHASTHGFGHRILEKMLLPVVAAAASAGATYAARKGPQLLDQRIGPKLRGLAGEAGNAAQDLPGRAKSAAADAGGMAEHLVERVTSTVGGVAGGSNASDGGRNHQTLSSDELERRRSEREKHRSARRRASR